MKLPSSVAPPGGPVPLPRGRAAARLRGRARRRDGRRTATVAGYAVADDVSARDLQRREPQWTRAKGADGVLPVRPVGDDRRRDRRPGEPRACAPGSTASCARTRRTSDLVFSHPRADRLHRRDDHAGARRPHPDRHARAGSAWHSTRRASSSPATSSVSRSRDWGRSNMASSTEAETRGTAVGELREQLAVLADLRAAEALLGWDRETMMPARGADARGEVTATLEQLAHERLAGRGVRRPARPRRGGGRGRSGRAGRGDRARRAPRPRPRRPHPRRAHGRDGARHRRGAARRGRPPARSPTSPPSARTSSARSRCGARSQRASRTWTIPTTRCSRPTSRARPRRRCARSSRRSAQASSR